jgi:hypothetical protein
MKYLIIGLWFLAVLLTAGCKKSKTPAPLPDEPIAFTTDAASTNTALANSFPVTVTLRSRMPVGGITISTTAVEQGTSAPIQQNNNIVTSTAVNALQVINLPRQRWCTVTIKIAATNTPGNNANRTFDVAYK